MAVLSDKAIRDRMSNGELVVGGDAARATECSYSFVAGAAFEPGSNVAAIEFPGADNKAEAIVKPGHMIWIRTLESVKIPLSIVGFWWQTNTLSRKGLMLVNMSMIEPGYAGDLACLFVNFGSSNVAIAPGTVIAKMIFMELSGDLIHPYRGHTSRQEYDSTLRNLAINQPSSFLKVGDLATDLSKARTEALEAIGNEATRQQNEAVDNIKKAADEAKEEASKGFKDDTKKTLIGSFGWAATALIIFSLVTAGGGWVKDTFFPDYKKVARSEAEKLLHDRVTINATPDSAEKAQLMLTIETLNKRIDALEKKK
jgi:deoxycytidine triphosphate deaminase